MARFTEEEAKKIREAIELLEEANYECGQQAADGLGYIERETSNRRYKAREELFKLLGISE